MWANNFVGGKLKITSTMNTRNHPRPQDLPATTHDLNHNDGGDALQNWIAGLKLRCVIPVLRCKTRA